MKYNSFQIAAMLNEIDPDQMMVAADFDEASVEGFNKLASRIILDAALEVEVHESRCDADDELDHAFNDGLVAAVNILRKMAA